MNWVEIAGLVLAAAGILGVAVWAVIESRARRVFAPLTDFCELEGKVGEMEKGQAEIRGLLQGQEQRIALLEQADLNQAERMSELVVRPLQKVVERLDAIATTQQRHGEMLATHAADLKSVGRTLDEFRIRIDRDREKK